MSRAQASKKRAKSVIAIGAGGNILSHGVSHLGRMPEVGRVTLIDRDVYEKKNLLSQDITPPDVGRPKAKVQAERLRRINPALDVLAIHDAVENVPLGPLRCDVILAGLDSREARRSVNQAAWRLGVAWIDAGVEAGGLLARVNVYSPGPDAPCLECAWDQRDYDALEQSYPCQGDEDAPPATNAPSSLGALAASLQAIECQKLLAGQRDRAAVGKQILIEATHQNYYLTTLRSNPLCRFDHETWNIEKLAQRPEQLTISQVLELGERAVRGHGPFALRFEGNVFATKVTCPTCGATRALLRLRRRLSPKQLACRECGAKTVVGGGDMLDKLDAAHLPPRALKHSLKSLGFRRGDVFTVCGSDGETHYEIGEERV